MTPNMERVNMFRVEFRIYDMKRVAACRITVLQRKGDFQEESVMTNSENAPPPLQQLRGWQHVSLAPHACHVLASYFDMKNGEWVYDVVMSPPKPPYTQWQMLPSPSENVFSQPAPADQPIQFRISLTGSDGCEIALSHWPEGYALERHGEIVWRERLRPGTPPPADQRIGLQKLKDALKPLADAVFNDNGDMTVSVPAVSADECIQAYFAVRQIDAALRQPAPADHVAAGDWRAPVGSKRAIVDELQKARSDFMINDFEIAERILAALSNVSEEGDNAD